MFNKSKTTFICPKKVERILKTPAGFFDEKFRGKDVRIPNWFRCIYRIGYDATAVIVRYSPGIIKTTDLDGKDLYLRVELWDQSICSEPPKPLRRLDWDKIHELYVGQRGTDEPITNWKEFTYVKETLQRRRRHIRENTEANKLKAERDYENWVLTFETMAELDRIASLNTLLKQQYDSPSSKAVCEATKKAVEYLTRYLEERTDG